MLVYVIMCIFYLFIFCSLVVRSLVQVEVLLLFIYMRVCNVFICCFVSKSPVQ